MKLQFQEQWRVELQYKISILLFLTLTVILNGCDFFATRNPEQPDIGKSNFLPPTEPSIVILNLETALKEKNIDNYMNCFYNFGDVPRLEFQFNAATDALTQFPSIFVMWGSNDERRSFSSIFASLTEGQTPKLNWINRQPLQETADSAVFTSDYYLYSPNNDNNIPDEYAGRLQFTMTFRNNGFWYISKWIDINTQVVDSVKNTWSVLKGFYYN